MSLESLCSITSLAREIMNSSVRLLKGSRSLFLFPYKEMLLSERGRPNQYHRKWLIFLLKLSMVVIGTS